MSDTHIDAYEAESDTVDPTVLYPIIASVFSAFCLISIALFLISNRKCCKQQRKYEDAESALLKQRLVNEQKRMSSYNFKFPFEHPMFSSVMQQESNEIADEVKESYKTISRDISKPILCCPNKKVSYIYNPQTEELKECDKSKIAETDQLDMQNQKRNKQKSMISTDCESKFMMNTECELKLNIDIIPDSFIPQPDFDGDSLNGNLSDSCKKSPIKLVVHCEEQLIDSLEKKVFNSKLKRSDKVMPSKHFTESEIENVIDLKSLFFNKWIKNSNDLKLEELASSHHDYENEMSYDDVESILTSISRMDSCRMQQLRDSKFYKNLISRVERKDDLHDEDIDEECFNNILSKTSGHSEDQNLTHEEIMQVVASPSIQNTIKHANYDESIKKNQIEHPKLSPDMPIGDSAKNTSDRQIIQKIINAKNNHGNVTNSSNENISQSMQPPIDNSDGTIKSSSEVFKSSKRQYVEGDINFTESTLTNRTASRTSFLSDTTYSESFVETDSIHDEHSTKSSRPRSLNLKRKHTELNIDVSFSDDELDSDVITSSVYTKKEYNTYTEENSSSSCSSRGSSITTWQEINRCNKASKETYIFRDGAGKKKGSDHASRTSARTSTDSVGVDTSVDSISSINLNKYRTRPRYKSPKHYKTNKQKFGLQTSPSTSLTLSMSESNISFQLNNSLDSNITRYTSKTNLSDSKSPKKLIPSQSLPKFVTGSKRGKSNHNNLSNEEKRRTIKKRNYKKP